MRLLGKWVKSHILLGRSWLIFLMARLAYGSFFPRVEREAQVEWVEGEVKAERARREDVAVMGSTAA
jgi:hypothetical protein